MPRAEVGDVYHIKWPTTYAIMAKHGTFPSPKRIGVVVLRDLHAKQLAGKKTADLAKSIGLSRVALRNRWVRLGLVPRREPNNRPKKLSWTTGMMVWKMRAKGALSKEICEALGWEYDAVSSPKVVRYHLWKFCYDSRCKVPSIKHGKREVVWLPPPRFPPNAKAR
jgi:hypothetical protein